MEVFERLEPGCGGSGGIGRFQKDLESFWVRFKGSMEGSKGLGSSVQDVLVLGTFRKV